ncbi:MAG: hypothetical protein M3Y77_20115 [Actinomycetota bacterium]|nr:hypothetical protein [Actinomycetota bacterium]
MLLAGCGPTTAGTASAGNALAGLASDTGAPHGPPSDAPGTDNGGAQRGQGVTPLLPSDGGTALPASNDQPGPSIAGPSSQQPVTIAPPSTENQASTAGPPSAPPLVVSTVTKSSPPAPVTSQAPQSVLPKAVSLAGFRSPSGNISCQIFTDEQPGYLRCDLTASNISPDATTVTAPESGASR